MEKIKDDEPMTPTESHILMSLLEKLANSDDMAIMSLSNKAQELISEINQL